MTDTDIETAIANELMAIDMHQQWGDPAVVQLLVDTASDPHGKLPQATQAAAILYLFTNADLNQRDQLIEQLEAEVFGLDDAHCDWLLARCTYVVEVHREVTAAVTNLSIDVEVGKIDVAQIEFAVYDDFDSYPEMTAADKAAYIAWIIENHPDPETIFKVMEWVRTRFFDSNSGYLEWLEKHVRMVMGSASVAS